MKSAFLISVALVSWLGPTMAKDPANFVVILTDDQSWVGTSFLVDPDQPESKSTYFRTPSMKRLAKRGMRFTDGYAPAPYCCPTRRSLLIGQCPARHIYQKTDKATWTKQFKEQLSLPRMLKKADPRYRTAHFGKWDHRFDDISPGEMGYDVSDGVTGNATGGAKGTGGPAAKADPKRIFEITGRAIDFIEEQTTAGNPFFVQVSHYAVHLDIFYREETFDSIGDRVVDSRHGTKAFAAMTEDVDAGIGQLLNALTKLKLDDQTYIFFLSDNGGRNSLPDEPKDKQHRNHPLRDGKGSMYEGGIRVPFVVAGPGIDPNSVCRVPVTGLDILPTLAALAGYSDSLPETLDGGSLVSLLQGGGSGKVERRHPFLIFHQAVQRKAESGLRLGNYKLVKTWVSDRVELFDLSKDLSEKNDLSKEMPEKTSELHRHLTTYLSEVGAETRKTQDKNRK